MAETVLLPGASLDTWIWDDIAQELDAVILPLPYRSDAEARRAATWEDIIETIANELRSHGAPVRLVGHSIGGLVASGVAAKYPELVAEIVYIGSVLPARGKAFLSIAPPPVRWIVSWLYRRNPTGMVPSAKMLRNELCNGLTEEQADRVCTQPVTDAPAMFTESIGWQHPSISSKYVLLTQDKAVPVKVQRAAIGRLGRAQVVEIASGHLPMLAAQDQLLEALRA